MKKGVFCISIDLELLWGRKDVNWKEFVLRVKKERSIIGKLLRLLERYSIPATWAVVGKMFEKGNPLWSGRDIVKLIKRYPNQEIGSHSYSHEIISSLSNKKAEEEISKSVDICRRNGVKPTSFVYPRNKVKYLKLLKKYGFKSFRGADGRTWELLFPAPPPVYRPTTVGGLVNIKGSMYFVSGRGIRKFLPFGLRFVKCWLGIRRAIQEKKVFHLWFHPVDFVDNEKKLLREFEAILKYADQKRKLGLLNIENMKGVT